jgi:hypothetical protein
LEAANAYHALFNGLVLWTIGRSPSHALSLYDNACQAATLRPIPEPKRTRFQGCFQPDLVKFQFDWTRYIIALSSHF